MLKNGEQSASVARFPSEEGGGRWSGAPGILPLGDVD